MFRLFDPKRVFIKIILFFCLLALVGNIILIDENARLTSRLIRQIDMFEFCYKLDLENIFKTMAELGEFAIVTNRNQVETIINITESISLIEKRLSEFKEKLKEHEPIDNIEKIKQSNFLISNLIEGYYGSGTHIKINGNDYILTCAHLLDKETAEMIATDDDQKIYWLKLVKIDKNNDLALYSMTKNNLPYLKISKENPKEGKEVVIIGNPTGCNDVVTNGIIAKKLKKIYVISNLAFYGNSGGALIYKGEIIGVASMIDTRFHIKQHQYVNYTIGINIETIREFLEGIE